MELLERIIGELLSIIGSSLNETCTTVRTFHSVRELP